VSANIELANRDSSEEMSEAASENGSVRAGRAVVAFQSRGSWAYLTASPAPFLDPGTEPCRCDTSPVASGRRWLGAHSDPAEDRKAMLLSEIYFQASCHYSYLETQGLGCMEKWATKLRASPLSQQKKSKAKGAVLTSVVRAASRNWRLTFFSDSLMIENCLFSSARVSLLPWTLSFPLASTLEVVSAHSC
jgi:hypothetical protein